MELVDTHCHLTFEPLASNIDGVIDRAHQSSVTRIVAPAYDPDSWKDAPAIGLDGVEPEKTEPRHVADIAAKVAEIRGESVERIAALTTANAKRLFRLERPVQ